MIAPNPHYQEPQSPQALDLEDRVNLSIVFSRYMQAEQEYNEASRRFNEACRELRETLRPDRRMVIRYNATHYLVETDAASNFDLEEIQSV